MKEKEGYGVSGLSGGVDARQPLVDQSQDRRDMNERRHPPTKADLEHNLKGPCVQNTTKLLENGKQETVGPALENHRRHGLAKARLDGLTRLFCSRMFSTLPLTCVAAAASKFARDKT